LDQLGPLPEKRSLFKQAAVRKSVRDDDMKPFIIDPLPKFTVREFFAMDIVKRRKTMGCACGFAWFNSTQHRGRNH
jgi:hypothetical protein